MSHDPGSTKVVRILELLTMAANATHDYLLRSTKTHYRLPITYVSPLIRKAKGAGYGKALQAAVHHLTLTLRLVY